MKPHRLTIEAFGPYADRATIEFDQLALDGLFLIHGPTGAGKTFLLDAMSFALFGEVAGARGRHTLRSDHADPRATPRAILEFSAHGHRYVAERSPTHTVPKVRGEGETTKPATATLMRLGGTAPMPVASSVTEVNREVGELLGLDAGQFQQVILLPQGRFEQVLRAGSEERELLLKTLFDTVLYERVTDWLDSRAKQERGLMYDQDRALTVLREQATLEWRPFSGIDAERATDAGDKGLSISPLVDQVALDDLVRQIGEVVKEAREAVIQAEQNMRTARSDKEAVDAIGGRWDRRNAARTRLHDLNSHAEEIAVDRETLDRAERAAQLRGSLGAEDERRVELDTHLTKIATHLREAEAACATGTALPPALTNLDLTGIPQAAMITNALTSLASHRTSLEELARKSVEAEAEATKSDDARTVEQIQLAVVSTTTREMKERQTERMVAAKQLETARTARDRLQGLEQAAVAARSRAVAATSLTSARDRLISAEGIATKAEGFANTARKAALDLRQRYLDGIASTLAGALADGQPCAVCGSTEHPAPAVVSSEAVTKAELDEADETAGRADVVVKSTNEAVNALAADVATLAAQAGEVAYDPAAGTREADRLDAERTAAGELAATITPVEERITALDALLVELDAKIAEAKTETTKASGSAEAAEARAKVLRAEVSEALGDVITPQESLHALADVVDALDALAGDAERETTLRSAHTTAFDHLARELEASPFADASDARRALLGDDTRTELSCRLKQHHEEVLKEQGILEAPDLVGLPDDRPDTATALSAVAVAEKEHTTAIEYQKGATDGQKELTRLAREHRTGETALAELRNSANLASGVADRCAGRVVPKVSLQRWVLSAYLEDICRHANARLEAMTAGRYRLLVHREAERSGNKSGLGLRVSDSFTGEEREVTTLSGGETFQASLALALGVADAVQAHTGGVHLDTLFIDEGFGTLDPDNLQLAMDELDRLREGGRMVGIISHVGALRERIRSGIEVIPTDTGSTVRVGEIALL